MVRIYTGSTGVCIDYLSSPVAENIFWSISLLPGSALIELIKLAGGMRIGNIEKSDLCYI